MRNNYVMCVFAKCLHLGNNKEDRMNEIFCRRLDVIIKLLSECKHAIPESGKNIKQTLKFNVIISSSSH
jgi:hypothetical protein